MDRDLGVYVHIPFCATKCNYCDFNTYSGIERLTGQFTRALRRELQVWGAALGRPRVNTLFFGGGTPSYINTGLLGGIREELGKALRLDGVEEATIEVNPDDVTPQHAEDWLAMGFNRVSMGAQSFNDSILQQMSRRHGATQIGTAFTTLRQAGFSNVSLDLIYGWPRQTIEQWRHTLESALALEPNHLSLYALQVERRTPLDRMVGTGELPRPDDDLAADMYELAEDLLAAHGLEQYEISNWAVRGMECRHNLKYWRMQPYLGVGPGAHSYVRGWRFSIVSAPLRYIAALEQMALPSSFRDLLKSDLVDAANKLSRKDAMGETMMMGLRLKEGVANHRFRQAFGVTLQDEYGDVIEDLTRMGLIEMRGNGELSLLKEARLIANEVFERFLVG